MNDLDRIKEIERDWRCGLMDSKTAISELRVMEYVLDGVLKAYTGEEPKPRRIRLLVGHLLRERK